MAEAQQESEQKPERKPQKSQQLILKHAEETALTQLERNPTGLALSGFSAGLDIGFSVLLMTVMMTLFKGVLPEAFTHVLVACMYPIGFIFVILGRSELFTEHTTLAILPVLERLASFKKLLRLWGIVYLSNILGGLLFAGILTWFAGSLHYLENWALYDIAFNNLHHEFLTTMLSAALAGWLMGLLAWLVAAARETISQILLIFIITASIGIIGLPHAIVGNIEVATALFGGKISFFQYLGFLIPVTIGNALGGVFFVGVLKFSHTKFSGREQEIILDEIEVGIDSNTI